MPLTDSRSTDGYVLSDAASVYFLEATSSELTLNRTRHAGEALQELGAYPPGDLVGSGQDGFVVHEGRYLRGRRRHVVVLARDCASLS